MYFSRQFYKHKNDIKSTWKVINEALHSKNDTDPPKYVFKDDPKVGDPAEIAEVFNEYFANIGPNLANNIPNVLQALLFSGSLFSISCISFC